MNENKNDIKNSFSSGLLETLWSISLIAMRLFGRLAQSVEHAAVNRKVVGSTPTLTVQFFF